MQRSDTETGLEGVEVKSIPRKRKVQRKGESNASQSKNTKKAKRRPSDTKTEQKGERLSLTNAWEQREQDDRGQKRWVLGRTRIFSE